MHHCTLSKASSRDGGRCLGATSWRWRVLGAGETFSTESYLPIMGGAKPALELEWCFGKSVTESLDLIKIL